MCIDLKQTFLNVEEIITLTKQDDRKTKKVPPLKVFALQLKGLSIISREG